VSILSPQARAAAGGLDSSQVTVAGFSRILVAPVGSLVPPSVTDDFDPPWIDLGYTTEDGLAASFGLDSNDLMSSQTLDPLRKLVTARPKTFTASLWQVNEETLRLALGGGTVTGTDDEWHFAPAPPSFIDERMLAIEAHDGPFVLRLIAHRTMVSEAVEFSFVNTDGVKFPLTFSVLANEPTTYDVYGGGLPNFIGGSTPPPTVTTVAPTNAAEMTATPVVITGTNLTGATAVDIGGACTGVQVVNATTVNAITPANVDAGNHPVRVTTPRGVITGPQFTYN
jgi:hypothetical protein